MSEQAAPAEQVITNKEKKSLDPRIAFCIMIVMICIALCIGARKAWIEKRIVVDTAYAEWQENIEQRIETGYNLLTVAGRYLPQDDPLVTTLKNDISMMETATKGSADGIEAAAASQQFVKDANSLLSYMSGNSAVTSDNRDNMYVSSKLPQAVEQSGRDAAQQAYNTVAESFNKGMHSFSGFLAHLTGVDYAVELPVISLSNQ